MIMRHRITMTEREWRSLSQHFTGSRAERMAFGFFNGYSTTGEHHHLLASLDLCADSEYRRQGPAGVSLPAAAAVARLVRARGCATFLDAHSHPFAEIPAPSSTDEEGAREQARRLHDLAPGVRLMRIIMGGSERVWAEVTDTQPLRFEPIDEIILLGISGRRSIQPVNAKPPGYVSSAPSDATLHLRTRAVLGDEALNTLTRLRVLVIGLGGTGSAVARLLAAYVPGLMLVDGDSIEIHNAPRLHFYAAGDEGNHKVAVARREISRAFPHSRAIAVAERFPSAASLDLLRSSDFVFCCPDHNAVRYAAAREAARYAKPLIDVGCGGRRKAGRIEALGSHVRLQVPGGACVACNGLDLRSLEDPSSTAAKRSLGYFDDDRATPGELMSLTTRTACDAVEVFLRYATGYASAVPRHLYFDALRLQCYDVTSAYTPRNGCSLCGNGAESVRAAGDSEPENRGILDPRGEVYAAV